MNWERIRSHYAQLIADARRAGVTQESVAKAGDLPGQNAISKLLANHNLGPSVETFVKAVKGLGMDVSVFFAEIEHGTAAPPVVEKPLIERIRDLELALEAIAIASSSSSQPSTVSSSPASAEPPPSAAHGRLHGVNSLSGSHFHNHISTLGRLDIEEFQAFVKAQFEMLARKLERRDDDLAEHDAANGKLHSATPAPRTGPRRRARKIA